MTHLHENDTSRIVESIVATVESSSLEKEPFDHFRMTGIFPEDVYQTIIRSFPDREVYHNLRHKDANLPDGTSTRKMLEFDDEQFAKLPDGQCSTWSTIRDALYDDRVKQAIFGKLQAPIDARIDHANAVMQLKGTDWRDVEAYPRPALYRDEAGYQITPHPDTPLKIATIQFYLPTDHSQQQLGTALYKRRTTLQRVAAPLASKYKVVKQFDFVPNSGYGFGVTQDSFHGREPISAPDGIRHSILLFYLRDDVKLTY